MEDTQKELLINNTHKHISSLNSKVDKTTTVNGHALSGDVTVTKSDVGLGNVDNTSDANKPVSTAVQTELNKKADKTTKVNGHELSGDVTVTKSDVGLGNVDNTSDADKPISTATQTELDKKVDNTTTVNGHALSGNVTVSKSDVGLSEVTNDAQVKRSEMGAINGVATLDNTGHVPTSQLPSYVDDVIEGYLSGGKFYEKREGTSGSYTYSEEISTEDSPTNTGKIYIDLETNKTYRWSGSVFVVISETLALGETSSTAYRGDRGKTAYNHATDSGRLTTATELDFYKVSVTKQGHVGSVEKVTKEDLNGLGIDADKVTTAAKDGANSMSAASNVQTVLEGQGTAITNLQTEVGDYTKPTTGPLNESDNLGAAMAVVNTTLENLSTTINNSKLSTKTWSELKTMKTSGTLVAGALYRITDYTTTISDAINTNTASNDFDIIVRALSTTTLDENVKAAKRGSSTYFDNENMGAWEIKYCLENDNTRFAWANTTTGKGVIYYMKDEYGNEAGYDFKNIQFKRDENWKGGKDTNATNYLPKDIVWYYTFSYIDSGNKALDLSLRKTVNSGWDCCNNVIKTYNKDNANNILRDLPNNIFVATYTVSDNKEKIISYNTVEGHGNTFGGRNVTNNYFSSQVINNTFANENYLCNNNITGTLSGTVIISSFINNTISGEISTNSTIKTPIFAFNNVSGSLTNFNFTYSGSNYASIMYCDFSCNYDYVNFVITTTTSNQSVSHYALRGTVSGTSTAKKNITPNQFNSTTAANCTQRFIEPNFNGDIVEYCMADIYTYLTE